MCSVHSITRCLEPSDKKDGLYDKRPDYPQEIRSTIDMLRMFLPEFQRHKYGIFSSVNLQRN